VWKCITHEHELLDKRTFYKEASPFKIKTKTMKPERNL